MNLKLTPLLLLAATLQFAARAEEHGPTPSPAIEAVSLTPAEKENVSYALGMRLGLQRKESKSDIDVAKFSEGLKDALDGRPVKMKDDEMGALFNEARLKGTNLPPDKKLQIAYAAGARTGGQLRKTEAELNADTMILGLNDVTDGKPTRLKEAEITPLLEKAQRASVSRLSTHAIAEGAAFLAKNAKRPEIKTLPDGLQYEILKAGAGRLLTTNDHIFLKWKGMFVDGREFEHHNHFPTTPGAGYQCWQDALQRMQVGSKWRIYSAPDICMGSEGEPHYNVPPNSTVIFDLEVREIVQADDPRLGLGRLGHGIEGRDDP